MHEHNHLVTQSLYQLPSCSICLNELTQNVASLGCGHTFHYPCIQQHFQYKGTCPNCQKRSSPKEIRPLVFPVVQNTKTGAYLKSLIENIDKTQGQQVHGLLAQIKALSEKSQKLQYNLMQAEKDLRKKNQQSERIKREIESKTIQVNSLRKQSVILNKQLVEATTNNNKLQLEVIQHMNRQNELQSQKRQMQQYKQIQKTAQKNSEQLMKFKNQMEGKCTPEMMAKSFFEMLQLKNLTILKMKERQRQYAQKYRLKQLDYNKLKKQCADLQKQNTLSKQDAERWQNKFERLRDKYREMVQKMKTKSQENIQNDKQIQQNSLSLSFGFSNKIGLKGQATMSIQKNQKNEKQLHFNIVQKPKPSCQHKISFGNQALKKQISQKSSGQITLKNFMN